MNHYIAAVLFLQFFFAETLQSEQTIPQHATELTWRDILPDYCGYRHKMLEKKLKELPRGRRSGGGNKVVGGKITTIDSHPWQVAIIRSDDKGLEGGGSIISKYHVLTAAHVFMKPATEVINDMINRSATTVSYTKRLVAVGTSRYTESNMVYKIKELYIHKFYSYSHRHNDIALIKIDGEFQWSSFVWPVCLPPEDEPYPPERGCLVTGYGNLVYKNTNDQEYFLHRDVELSTDSYCKKENEEKQVVIADGMFCASGRTDKESDFDTCQGDSGGPLDCESSSSEQRLLLGITSFGHECGLKNYPGVYTKVSKYVQWIRDRVEVSLGYGHRQRRGISKQELEGGVFPRECGILNVTTDDGGSTIEKTPWLVAVAYTETNKVRCSGVVISEKYVLTTAYCANYTESPETELCILAGDVNLQETKQEYNIARVTIHPDYNPWNTNDIALIEISGKFSFSNNIQPICMPYHELYKIDRQVLSTCWTQPSIIKIFRSINTIISKAECTEIYNGIHAITAGMFCVTADVDRSVWFADTGGPVFVNEGAHHYLLGMHSFRKLWFNNPKVNTKVISYMEWIQDIMTGGKSKN